METTLQYEKKVAHDILLVATYKNALGDTFTESFHLLLKEQAKSWRMRPSDMIPSANGRNSLLRNIAGDQGRFEEHNKEKWMEI
jgi:hypothetical protein